MEAKGQTAVEVGGYLIVVLGVIALIVAIAGAAGVGPMAIVKDPVLGPVSERTWLITTVVAILIILLGVGFVAIAKVLSRVTGALRI